MNRQKAKELLPIIQAFADGKEIQYKSAGGWMTLTSNPMFFAEPGEYRIKPEPMVIYAATGGERDRWFLCASQNKKNIRGQFTWRDQKIHRGDRMNSRTETITYTDKKGNIVMQSFNDYRRDREDKTTACFFGFIALAIWIGVILYGK